MVLESLAPARPLGSRVRVISTLRGGGVSMAPYGAAPGQDGGLNLGLHCGDDPAAVSINRARLQPLLPGNPFWLQQVHGTVVACPDDLPMTLEDALATPPVADASVTSRPRQVLAVLTADCMPVVLAGLEGQAVAIAHAGWRGLAAGIIEQTMSALQATAGLNPQDCSAWLGPAIGAERFEVGEDVRSAFCSRDPAAARAFRPAVQPGKWLACLETLARLRLGALGLTDIIASGACTATESERFYSFRRDRVTGRMATLVWIE